MDATEMPGIEEANAELDRLIAEDAKGTTGTPGTEKTDTTGSADTEAQRAAQTAAAEAQANEKAKAESGKQKAEAGTDADKAKAEAEAAAAATKAKEGEGKEEKSRYAKAQERLGGTWAEVNAAKAALKAEQDAAKLARETFEREKQEFASKREAEAEFSPEQYEAAASRFEAEGKFDLAELAKSKAGELRKNPPVAKAAADESQRKEWALKAGTDFPELAKTNSPVQQRVAQLFQEEPELKTHPKGIYIAARIASLESQATEGQSLKATVAGKDTELAGLRAKVSELEALTAPGGSNGVTRLPGTKDFAQMSSDEQFADLQRMAEEVGSLR